MLKPWSFPIGTKRMPLDTNYYETFNRPNVTLVDLRRTPVEEVTPAGIRNKRRPPRPGRHRLRHRVRRAHRAARGARHPRPGRAAAAGRMAGGTVHLPGRGRSRVSPTCSPSPGPAARRCCPTWPVSIEQHVEWIGDWPSLAARPGRRRDRGVPSRRRPTGPTTCSGAASATLHPKAATWYMGANIPGKPRVFLPYIGGVGSYRDHCAAVAADGLPGPLPCPARRRATNVTRPGDDRAA